MAMGQLLTTRASMDSQCRSLVSNTKTTIKEAKVLCTVVIWDAETKCTAAIREAETICTDHTHTLQWSLDESMEDLECETIEKEGQDHQSFLEVCRAALQDSPTDIWGATHVPLAVADGEHVLSCPFGYDCPTGCSNWETHPCNFPSNCVGDTHASNGDQTMMSFI